MRVLVFGAGGYLGIPLCEELERRGHWVQAADRFFFGRYPALKSPPLHADIRTYQCGEGLFDAVIDLAGLSNDASADIDPAITRAINLDGAMHLADLAKRIGVRKYVYSSSCSVYGSGVYPGRTEANECRPLTLYAECKVKVEDHLRSLAGDGFVPVILRNATVFGTAPRMRFDLAVNVMTLRAWRDHLIYVMGGGQQIRPFVHIRDAVAAFVLAVEKLDQSGTLNVGSNAQNCSIEQLAALVAHEFPIAQLHRIPDDPDKRSYHVAFDAIERTGYRAGIGIADGIREIRNALIGSHVTDDATSQTLDWYRQLIGWERRLDEIRLEGRIL